MSIGFAKSVEKNGLDCACYNKNTFGKLLSVSLGLVSEIDKMLIYPVRSKKFESGAFINHLIMNRGRRVFNDKRGRVEVLEKVTSFFFFKIFTFL